MQTRKREAHRKKRRKIGNKKNNKWNHTKEPQAQ